MKKFILCVLIFVSNVVYSQKIDTLIVNDAYQVFFNYDLKEPLFIRYKLYKGGGDCSRDGMSFKSESFSAKKRDYAHSGYDIGHMANTEDFAYDCIKDEMTFRFYNALPQTANLNRGVWKIDETNIRELSQTDSLLILCGGIFKDSANHITYIGDSVAVPVYCWKIVYSYKANKIIMCRLYTNTQIGATVQDVKPVVIVRYMKINILKYINFKNNNF